MTREAPGRPADTELLERMDAYWRAANYLSVGQIYLCDNPLLREPLAPEHIKRMLLGHWGTTPGQNFIYTHLNRIINEYDLDMIYISGPGHGGPAVLSGTYLEGTYSEIYSNVSEDEAGLKRLFTQFSFPGGVPSHASAECPGSIHEGGELGYSLSHAFGAVLDNPSLTVACVVGDGEAETGPLATAWHSNKFLNAATDGAVLPILHLNGYKIANPTVLARISREELDQLLRGYGWTPHIVEGHEPMPMHQAMAATLDRAVEEIRAIQHSARAGGKSERPRWPMIVLISPKGWTGPKEIDGRRIEGSFRSHQVPITDPATNPAHLRISGGVAQELPAPGALRRAGQTEAGAQSAGAEGQSPHGRESGGERRRAAARPSSPGFRGLRGRRRQARRRRHRRHARPRAVSCATWPRETRRNETSGYSGRMRRCRTAWKRCSSRPVGNGRRTTIPDDEFLAPTGQVMEMLSEHQCEGWLEGYLLTGRHGLFNCYEAFIHIVDSMFNQHAKWLKVTASLPWRRKIASLNYLLSSHVWRQDHNGFTHQDPGFIDHVINKKAEVVRVYLPPDSNCLLSVMDHCLRSRHYVNVVVAGKHPAPQWLSMDAARNHCTEGAGIWQWASNDQKASPTSSWPVPATYRPSRRWPRCRSCASIFPSSRSASSTWSTS